MFSPASIGVKTVPIQHDPPAREFQPPFGGVVTRERFLQGAFCRRVSTEMPSTAPVSHQRIFASAQNRFYLLA
jgi:hypothetical protein